MMLGSLLGYWMLGCLFGYWAKEDYYFKISSDNEALRQQTNAHAHSNRRPFILNNARMVQDLYQEFRESSNELYLYMDENRGDWKSSSSPPSLPPTWLYPDSPSGTRTSSTPTGTKLAAAAAADAAKQKWGTHSVVWKFTSRVAARESGSMQFRPRQ